MELTRILSVSTEWLYVQQRNGGLSRLVRAEDEEARVVNMTPTKKWFGRRALGDLPSGRYLDEDLAEHTEIPLEDLRLYGEREGYPLASETGPTVFPKAKVLLWLRHYCRTPEELVGDFVRDDIGDGHDREEESVA